MVILAGLIVGAIIGGGKICFDQFVTKPAAERAANRQLNKAALKNGQEALRGFTDMTKAMAEAGKSTLKNAIIYNAKEKVELVEKTKGDGFYKVAKDKAEDLHEESLKRHYGVAVND